MRFIYQDDYELAKSLGPENTIVHQVQTEPQPTKPDIIPALDGSAVGKLSRSDSTSTTMTKDAKMNQMVDALVGDGDGLEPLNEEDENLPVTPPANTFDDSPMVRDPSNSASAITANDLVNQVQNWQHKNSPGASAFAARNSPGTQFLAGSPSPQDNLNNWPRPGSRSNPSSPYNAVNHGAASGGSLSMHSPQSFAAPVQSPWHSRGDSAASLQLQTNNAPQPISRTSTASPFPNPLFVSSPQATDMNNSFGSISSIWGVQPNVPTADWVRRQQPRYQEPQSSTLFGPDGYPYPTDTRNGAPQMARGGSSGMGFAAQNWNTPTSGQGG